MSIGLNARMLKSEIISGFKRRFIFSEDEKTCQALAESIADVIAKNNEEISKGFDKEISTIKDKLDKLEKKQHSISK